MKTKDIPWIIATVALGACCAFIMLASQTDNRGLEFLFIFLALVITPVFAGLAFAEWCDRADKRY